MMKVHRISAVTLKVNNMKRSCQFYSKIPGFRIVYGGGPYDAFSTFELGGRGGEEGETKTYLNLELAATKAAEMTTGKRRVVTFLPNSSNNNDSKRQYHYDNYNNSAIGGGDRQSHERDEDDNEGTNLSEEEAFLQTSAKIEGREEGEQERGRSDFGRIIFHTENVDDLYRHMAKDEFLSKHIIFETEPADAPWGERFFHIREPDGYQLSFAQLLKR